MFNVFPDDPKILDMDPIQKYWMFENWLEDTNQKYELAKNHAYLLGSFWNPDAVKNLVNDDNKFVSTDEELEESMKMVRNYNKNSLEKNTIKRRRRKIKNG